MKQVIMALAQARQYNRYPARSNLILI